MYRYIAYLKFLFTSKNQHGVHSPFVYDFITKNLYRSKKSKSKTTDVLLKSIAFLEVKSLKLMPKNASLEQLIRTQYPAVHIHNQGKDLHYYANFDALDTIESSLEHAHNDAMILINDIHKNSQSTQFWNQLREHLEVRVSLDLFYCGIVFVRKEQAKEHFKIRI